MIECCICGNNFAKRCYFPPYDDICSSECFEEKFWRIKENEYLNGKPFIIINGTLFSDAGNVKNPRNTRLLGHSGRVFRIKMNNGIEIVTNNLWCCGDIPENHRDVLSDNATFLNESRCQYGI